MCKLKSIFFCLLVFPLINSCEKIFIEKDLENTPENNFELLWTTFNQKYSFFEYKKINWDSIYNVYRPKINSGISNEQLFDIFSDMLLELRDGHVNLYSITGRSKNYEWYSASPSNFNYSLLANYYFGNNFQRTSSFITTSLGSAGYIYCGTFSEMISERELDMIIEKFYDKKGIIFDVRNNSGGFSKNSRMIASRFADRKHLVSYTLYKTGAGHSDFSQPQPNYISPDGRQQFLKPVVVITNRRIYSATNDFVLNMSAFPHVTVIGDTTGGGGGTPYDYELLNGWRYRFPRTQTLGADGFNIEDGIAPSIQEDISKNDEAKGIDTIIETALGLINKAPDNPVKTN